VSKFGRGILGINMQMLIKKKIVIRTLGMVELKDCHTRDLIATAMKECMNLYGIQIEQLYSITSDNGANMVAAIDDLAEFQDMQIEMQDLEKDLGKTHFYLDRNFFLNSYFYF
jgi:hypothetical protein